MFPLHPSHIYSLTWIQGQLTEEIMFQIEAEKQKKVTLCITYAGGIINKRYTYNEIFKNAKIWITYTAAAVTSHLEIGTWNI